MLNDSTAVNLALFEKIQGLVDLVELVVSDARIRDVLGTDQTHQVFELLHVEYNAASYL